MRAGAGIRIALVDLEAARDALGPPTEWIAELPECEQRRATGMAEPDALAWLAGRLALRRLLGELAAAAGAAPARALERRPFVVEADGRPMLPGGPRFSLSHSAGRAAIVVGAVSALGIDLEASDRMLRFSGSRALRILAAGRGLGAERSGDDRRDLLASWTRLEALAKARGTGLWPLLTETGVHGATAADLAEIERRATEALTAAGLAIVDVAWPGAHCLIALAAPVGAEIASTVTVTAEDPRWIAAARGRPNGA